MTMYECDTYEGKVCNLDRNRRMKQRATKHREVGFLILAILVILLALGYWGGGKNDLMLDEIYSYGLANSAYMPFVTGFREEGIVDSVITREQLLDYITVDESARFQYDSVYYNQTCDVHPPLFYFLLHTISSLSAGYFSKWIGLGLNMTIFIAIAIVFYLLMRRLSFSPAASLLCLLLYGLSKVGMNTVLTIRMYTLLTLLTILLVYLLLGLKESIGSNRRGIGYYIGIFITIFLGMITQYFYAIYACLLCIAFDVVLIKQKRWKEMTLFSVSALAGVATMMLCFPSWYAQLHSQETVSLGNVVGNLGRIAQYSHRIGIISALTVWEMSIVGILYGVLFLLCIKKEFRSFLKERLDTTLLMICIPAIVAFLIICIVEPYVLNRYIYHLVPMAVIPLGCLYDYLQTSSAGKMCKKLAIAITGICLVAAFTIYEPYYIYDGMRETNDVLASTDNDVCVYITENYPESVTENLLQLINFEEICVVNSVSGDFLNDYMTSHKDADEVALFISNFHLDCDDIRAIEEMSEAFGYTTYEQLNAKVFSNIYLLSR